MYYIIFFLLYVDFITKLGNRGMFFALSWQANFKIMKFFLEISKFEREYLIAMYNNQISLR